MKLIAALNKELLILIRDIPGLLILFIMPLALVIIVTVAQENAIKNSRETKSELLVANLSQSQAAQNLIDGLKQSGLYHVIDSADGGAMHEDIARLRVEAGEATAAIIIQANDSAVYIVTDPAVQENFRGTLITQLTYSIKSSQSKSAAELLFQALPPDVGNSMNAMMNQALSNLPPIREVNPNKQFGSLKPSLSQNAIPGFILFAMFFVVIPLSGSILIEKTEGSFQRLKSLPVPILTSLMAKVLLYLGVCIIQFLLMLMAGKWLLPGAFGLSQFTIGTHYLALLLLTVACGLSATGFGIAVGSLATTHAQAALFGSVMVVILSIVSGTFLPIHLFPPVIQFISWASPIRWGIDGFLELFIRNGSILKVIPNIILLLLFFILAMTLSVFNFAKRSS